MSADDVDRVDLPPRDAREPPPGGPDCAAEAASFEPAGGYALALGALGTIFPTPGASGNMTAGTQNAGFGLDVIGADDKPLRKIFVTFSHHDDVGDAVQTDGVMTSTDGAGTFAGYRAGVMSAPSFALQLRDGRVVSYGFVPTKAVDTSAGSELTLQGDESEDDGKTWKRFSAIVKLPRLSGGIGRISGHPIELGDGTIFLPYYGRYAGDKGLYRAELLASHDAGRSFVRHGTIAVPAAGNAYPEPDVIELRDGTLYSVFRQHIDGGLAPLLWSRSKDGIKWSPAEKVMIPFDGRPATARTGVAPRLLMMPNGTLVLSSGRHDNFIAVSTEYDKVSWREAKITYVNHPTKTTAAYGPEILRAHGSSGNTGIEVLEANRLVQFGDNCANSWGCPAADSGHTIDNKNRVWRRFIDIVTPDVGKIDLLSKFQRGLIRVASDMTWTSKKHPRARVDGAFDGSTEYWSSAVKSGGPAAFTIELDRVYELTRVGLSIRHGAKASASVFTSMDGVTFCPSPVVRMTDRTHRAIEYSPLTSPTSARFVRIVVDGSAQCDAELGAACSFLNEVELYSTTDSFENDPIGGPPRGYTDVSGASVIASSQGETRRLLRVTDSSDATVASATWRSSAAETKTLEFSVRPQALPGGFLFGIAGKDAHAAVVKAFHLAVMPDGRLARYDAATEKWISMSAAGAVPVGRWSRIRVEAALDRATVLVDGVALGIAPPSAPGATSLDSHAFGSSGTKPKGDDVLIDDVDFR